MEAVAHNWDLVPRITPRRRSRRRRSPRALVRLFSLSTLSFARRVRQKRPVADHKTLSVRVCNEWVRIILSLSVLSPKHAESLVDYK